MSPRWDTTAILEAELRLCVGAQHPRVAAAVVGQALEYQVGLEDGGGHLLLGLVAGVAEHEALIAGSLDASALTSPTG